MLIDVAALEKDYYERVPDLSDPAQLVSFGTSGHRGTSSNGSFTDAHIAAITQAICDYRKQGSATGPIFMGKDTHALSSPAQRTALEVLAANGVETIIAAGDGVTPSPVISHSILGYNRGRGGAFADGIIITPSHNPPADGGFKYNPPNGGPADTDVTGWVQDRANDLLGKAKGDVKRMPYSQALAASTTHQKDLISGYVDDLNNVIDMDSIRASGLRIGVDPLGGASLPYWAPIAERFGLNITVVNQIGRAHV